MSERSDSIAAAEAAFDSGKFLALLEDRVAIPTDSQNPDSGGALLAYLQDDLTPYLEGMGFSCRILDNPVVGRAPLLFAERHEDPALLTVLSYGHGDVVPGMDERWRNGCKPWALTREGDRIYGRGTADNKGQHTLNLAALAAVLETRGRLGFNCKLLIETGEEIGSPGLHAVCAAQRDLLAADLFLASDGPRLDADSPTLYLGSRGVINFDLVVELRDGAHHSGNWGGLISSPGIILANALASMADANGKILVEAWRPKEMDPAVSAALKGLEPRAGGAGGPAIEPDWGEPGLSPAEKVYGWPSFEILAFKTGDPDSPANAIPPKARAACSLRTTVDIDGNDILPGLRRHLDSHGFHQVEVRDDETNTVMAATRTSPGDPWARRIAASVERTLGRPPVVLPNLGGSIPNDAFGDILGLPTVWVPHSYAGCSQHAPDEHLLAPVARQGLAMMAGIFWDLGDQQGEWEHG